MSNAAQTVVVARQNSALAVSHAESVEAEINTLNLRLAGAKERYADALKGLREKSLNERIAAARMAAATADIEDLQAMIFGRQSAAELAEEARSCAAQAVAAAEHMYRQEELRLIGSALDNQISHIESTLCAALAERHRVALQMDGGTSRRWSLFNIWRPSEPLRRAVESNEPPAA